ncbi:amino acid transporter [Neorhizobium lilium]|uniref:Amino acid transporter n=1 Tax=Neorhizobium lilium TaxID=2503024 RepID=A0A3S3S2N0_9HYPH|nr:amino acid transporter [Neorhizobium lilium]
MSNLVRNERTKLTATYFNGAAVAVAAVGTLAPLISSLNTPAGIPNLSTAISCLVCLFASGILHFIARRLLKGLIE